MADIYSRMAAVSARLLAPTSGGGMGQGIVILTRVTPGLPGPNQWDPVTPTTQSETLRAAVRGVDRRLVGTAVGDAVILASDRQVICSPPAMEYTAGDVLSVDGVPVNIISVEKLPAAGITSAVKFIIRG